MTTSERIQILETCLDRQLGWIRAADTKSALALAINTAMVGVLASLSPHEYNALLIITIIGAFMPLLSIAYLCSAAFPRTTGPGGSLVYFGGISERTADQFRRSVSELSEESYFEDIANQCHRNAEIASLKYRRVQAAYCFLFAGVVPWIIVVNVLYASR